METMNLFNDEKKFNWTKIQRDGLDLDYTIVYPKNQADYLFANLETIEYENPEITKIKICGKWYNIPRQQVAFGDRGTSYTFSGTTVPAKPWPKFLLEMRNLLLEVTGFNFNFVLVNKYRNGHDYIGEHKDNESDLDQTAPIASISLGHSRDFVLKHQDARKKGDAKKDIPVVKVLLEHGSLLLMNPPTNKFWYHSLPQRKSVKEPRINLTFRVIKSVK